MATSLATATAPAVSAAARAGWGASRDRGRGGVASVCPLGFQQKNWKASLSCTSGAGAASGKGRRGGAAVVVSALVTPEVEAPVAPDGDKAAKVLLEVKGLTAVVADSGKEILRGVDLVIRQGEIHAIMGKNGSGKSTLSKVLVGHPDYEVTGGTATFKGENLFEKAPEERSHSGLFLSFQSPVEIPGVSNMDFLRMACNARRSALGLPEFGPLEFYGYLSPKLTALNMDPTFLDRNVNEGFSGGEKKRNEILQLAVLEADMAILDEIDSGLDVDALRDVASAVNGLLKSDNAVLMITHYQRLLDYIKPNFVHIMDGGLARKERNATMFMGGVRRRGACQDSFVNRTRSKDIIRASAEEKKKAGGISFGDQLLDYIEGGPKLRKWYGAPDQLTKDSGNKEQKPEDQESVEADDADKQDLVRDVVLVTDAESATGQLVVLELILRRLRIRALVKDIKAATVGFGAYVELVEGDVNDMVILKKVMRGVRAIICPTKVGKLANRELVKGVEHIVLLSKLAVSKNQGGLGALFGGLSKRDAEANEAAIASLGIPYTIVRAGSLKDEEGGKLGFRYGQDGNVQGSISREDAAYVCVEALDSPPQSARVFEVANGREEVEDWSVVLTSMQETTTASGS